jgi:hypothetical protein
VTVAAESGCGAAESDCGAAESDCGATESDCEVVETDCKYKADICGTQDCGGGFDEDCECEHAQVSLCVC